MARIEPETFGKDIQAEALKNGDVVLNLLLRDEAKFREFGRKAKASKKRQVIDTLTTSTQPVPPQDYLRMMQRVGEINTNTNWQV